MPTTLATTATLLVGYVVGYVFLDWLSYIRPIGPLGITPWSPGAGLSFALLLALGARFAPALFIAALAGEIVVRSVPALIVYEIASSAVIAIGYGLAASLLLGPLRFDRRFRRLRDVGWLLGIATGVALAVAAGYVAVYIAGGVLRPEDFGPAVLRFWVGDVIGIAVVTPLALVLARTLPVARIAPPSGETLLQAVSVAGAVWVVFGVESIDEFKAFYLLFLPLIWVAMRHGITGATIAIGAIQIGVIAAIQLGGYRPGVAIELQLLMLALAVTGLFLGMAVTERADAREALKRTLPLAAAGEMASAIAHELNQPLSAINAYLRACQAMLNEPPRERDQLSDVMGRVVNEATRAGEVVRRLRDFYTRGSSRLEPAPVTEILAEATERVAERARAQGVTVRAECPDGLPRLTIDRVQIATVMRNLTENALDALAVSDGERLLELRARSASGGAIEISVADSGVGVAPRLRDELFEPFVSDKVTGMGLGLSLSRSIVEAHGGKLWFESRAGRGSVFKVLLPVQEPSQHDDD